jgi:hypothetical protein
MAENPYQAPQTRHEVPLLPAWRRRLSNLLIIVGLLAVVLLALMIAATVGQLIILNRFHGTLEDEHVQTTLTQMREVLVCGLVLAPTAPGLLFSGLAIRRMIPRKLATTIILALTIAVSAYMLWWWSEAKHLLQPELPAQDSALIRSRPPRISDFRSDVGIALFPDSRFEGGMYV